MAQFSIDPDQPKRRISSDPAIDKLSQPQAKVSGKATATDLAIIYEATSQITTLATTIRALSLSSSVSDANLQQVASPPIESNQDPVRSIAIMLQSIEDQKYKTNPNQFYHQLLVFGQDCNEILDPTVRKMFIDEIKSRIAPCLADVTSQKSLALALAHSYAANSKKTKDTTQLESLLSLYLSPNHSLVDATIATYKNSIASHNEMPNVKKHQKELANAMEIVQPWQNDYNNFMQGVNSNNFSIDLFVNVVSMAPNGTEAQMKAVSRWIEPVLKDSSGFKTFAKALSLHFSQANNRLGSQKALKAFVEKMQTTIPSIPAPTIHQLLQNCMANMLHLAFNPSDPMTQNEINRSKIGAANALGSSAGSYADWIHNVIHTAPIMMAIYIVLMSGQGAYGFLAKIMGEINGVMSNLKQYNADIQEIETALNDIMKNGGTAADFQAVANGESDLNNLLGQPGAQQLLGDSLFNSLKQFCAPGTGSLDQLINAATGGSCTNWQDAAKAAGASPTQDPDDYKKFTTWQQDLTKYMTAPSGGAAPAPVTTVFSNISNLLGSLNTMNQAQMERLNLMSQKVDSCSKLFASCLTIYKGVAQTLTNYAGI